MRITVIRTSRLSGLAYWRLLVGTASVAADAVPSFSSHRTQNEGVDDVETLLAALRAWHGDLPRRGSTGSKDQ